MAQPSRARPEPAVLNSPARPQEMNCATQSVDSPAAAVETLRLNVSTQPDVLMARQKGRDYAISLGFTGSDVTVIAAAVCEIARNMVDYAQGGAITFSCIRHKGRS